MTKARKTVVLLSVIMASVCTVLVGSVLVLLYNMHLSDLREHLTVAAQSQARLIESVVRHEEEFPHKIVDSYSEHDPAMAVALAQVVEAHEKYRGFGKTGEFTLARREGNLIVFQFRHRHDQMEIPQPVPFASEFAEPMRRALSGLSGTMIGLDYHGDQVLAAHEPVSTYCLGIVAKIDMSEVRGQFVTVAMVAAAITLFLVLAGAAVFWRVSNPMVVRLESHARELQVEIDERKRTEAERERLMLAIEQATEVIVITDADGTIQYVNPAFERITGYTCKEAVGLNPRILKSGQHNGAFYKEMWDTLTRGETWRGEIINKKKDGTLYTEGASISPVRDAAGNTVSYVAVKHDISERKRIEERLSKAQRLEDVGLLAGQIAHDFNNLLGPLIAYPDIIRSKMGLTDECHRILSDMEAAAQQMADINQDLLTLGRRGRYNRHDVDINELIEEIVRTLEMPDGITLHTNLAPDLSPVKASGGQLARVLMNVLVNAIDAMGNSGTLTVKSESVRLDDALRGDDSARPGDYVKLIVTDSGPGIPAGVRNRIFEPFFTTKAADGRRGSGLGLSIVQAVVDDHGGYIEVETVVGEGTAFTIYLPATQKAEAMSADVREEIPRGCGQSVLMVDDDPFQQEIVQRILGGLGYNVSQVSSGEEAVSFVADHPQDLLVLDMVMDGIDGAETLRRIKETRPDQAALILSGYQSNKQSDLAIRYGARKFLQKPINRRELATAVHEALSGCSVFPECAAVGGQ